MKRIYVIIYLIATLSCSESEQQNGSGSHPVSSLKTCAKSLTFGEGNICLPYIEGMTECYTTPSVSAFANRFIDLNQLTILGYYLDNTTYEQLDNLDQIPIYEFIQVYSVNMLMNDDIGIADLDDVADDIEDNHLKDDWDNIRKMVETNQDHFTIGRPVLIERYAVGDQVRTFIMLMKFEMDSQEFIRVVALSITSINNRLTWLMYARNYTGEGSVKVIKRKSDSIVLQFTRVNTK